MSNLEEELAKLAGAKYFAKLDFAQGLWQLPTDWEAALLFAFRGVDGLHASTRVPHGAKNSAQWFQLLTSEYSKEFLYCLRLWIDDFLLHTKTVQGLLEVLRQFFEICRKKGFKLHAVKCDLFGTKAEWCGRTNIARVYQVQPEKSFRSGRHGASTDSSGFAAIFMWVELAAHLCSELGSTGRPALAYVGLTGV
jgi:Reverse transcriptase (RNA-dependent DNA polymerase)